MDSALVNAVLAAVKNVMKMMVHQDITHAEPYFKQGNIAFGEVSSYIYLVNVETKASVSVSFPYDVIKKIAEIMLPPGTNINGEVIKDLTQEMANMFAGGAKSTLEDAGLRFEMSLPKLIAGSSHEIKHVSKKGIMMIPLNASIGPFFVEICCVENRKTE